MRNRHSVCLDILDFDQGRLPDRIEGEHRYEISHTPRPLPAVARGEAAAWAARSFRT
jgi:hypothetical protein